MTMHNFGVIKATFTNYMNESENLHAKAMFANFMKLLKESKSLQTVHKFYKNLEEKYIPNEGLAIKYIDENVNMIKQATSLKEALTQLQKVMQGLTPNVSTAKSNLFENITILMEESTSTNVDVDRLHESFTFILEHIKNNKPKVVETIDATYSAVPKEFLIKKAIEKFNTRYTTLSESDQSLFKSIISNNVTEKQKMFSLIKEETVGSLKSINVDADIDSEKINESIEKINGMVFNLDTYSKDVLTLNDLKSEITQ